MALGGYDGSIRIDTRIDTKNVGTGLNKITQSLKGVAAAVGIAFGVAAVVNFGKASVKAASDFSNAMKGLKSIVEGQGRSFKDTKGFIDEYISDGLLPATEAATAYKNLATRGYSDTQIEQVLVALKDSAAFGRQASLSLGQAVSSATEGLKNENSILVDNAGVTKNVSVMWKEYAESIGVGVQSLTKQQKIQAEVNGILNESRYQTGDAAKVANTYSGQILQLSFNFNNLKIAIGNCITPIIQGILPALNTMLKTLTKVANAAAQVFSALFGTKMNDSVKNQNAVTDSVQDTVNAENQLTESAKEAKKAMLGIDEINKIESNQEDSASALPPSSGASTPGIGGGESDVIGDNVELSPKLQAAVNTLKGIFSDIKTALEPTKQALQDLWAALEPAREFVWQGLKDFYNEFLKPMGNWVFSEALPRFFGAIGDAAQKIDWDRLNASLQNFWNKLEPFAETIGEGLLWFWENVLVPLGTWVISSAVPIFLDLLSAALSILAPIIEVAKDTFKWLWDNFLQPIAQWTGGIIVSVLQSLADVLAHIGDWMGGHKTEVEAITMAVVDFFLAWKAVQLMSFIQQSGGVVTALKNICTAITAGTIAKVKDLVETAALNIMYAKDFVVSLASGTAALVKQAAQWVINTAVKIADTVATWASQAAALAATAATWLFNAALVVLTSPITWVIVAIGALIAIVVLCVKHWDEIKEVAKKCWDAIVEAWKAAGEWFKTTIVEPIKTFFSDLWNSIKTAAKACWDWIVSVWTGVCDWFNEKVIQPVKTFFSSLWDGVKNAAQYCWDWICSIWRAVSTWFYNNVVAPIANVFSGLWDGVKRTFSNAWDFISSAFKGYVNGWINMIENFINFFVSGINILIRGINKINFKVPDWIPGLGGQSIGFDIRQVPSVQLPRLATGAVIPPRAEFAAILGDQQHGRNLEAPESLIRQIVREESNNNVSGGDWTIQIVGVDGELKAETIITALERHNRCMGRTVVPIG